METSKTDDSATKSLSTAFVALRGALYAACFVWLWGWLAVSVRRLDGWIAVPLPEWLRGPGYLLAGAGALLAASCVLAFVTRGRGTPAPFDPPQRFVATGPYRYVRNPMYIGGALVMFGAALVATSLSIVLLSFGFLLVMHVFVVGVEEPGLLRRFGDSYATYRSEVHRWVVRLPRKTGE